MIYKPSDNINILNFPLKKMLIFPLKKIKFKILKPQFFLTYIRMIYQIQTAKCSHTQILSA